MKNIYVDIAKLMSPDTAGGIRRVGLHKLAAARLRMEGFSVGDELTLRDAITVLGSKLRRKHAEHIQISEGLEALKKVGE